MIRLADFCFSSDELDSRAFCKMEEKEVDVAHGEVDSSKNEGPPFLCKSSC